MTPARVTLRTLVQVAARQRSKCVKKRQRPRPWTRRSLSRSSEYKVTRFIARHSLGPFGVTSATLHPAYDRLHRHERRVGLGHYGALPLAAIRAFKDEPVFRGVDRIAPRHPVLVRFRP